MTLLDDLTERPTGLVKWVGRLSSAFGGVSRRSFLVRTAVAGSALTVDAAGFVLRPQTAYATVCGPANKASDGWTVFCCTINRGVNACPPGSFAAGWWKAADSSWCCGGYRYIVDCNAQCTKCSSGCAGDHVCDRGCWNCSCGAGSSATCDQRRICCNAFRYGQCNTQVKCSGGVHCRVVSCVPPYQWEKCTTTSLRDDDTAEHNAPCLQGCGPILTKYDAMGANGSYLKGSVGPERAVGDNRGRYVAYQGGSIYWTTATRARALTSAALSAWTAAGGPRGKLGYPTSDTLTGARPTGWVQLFERGAIADSTTTTPQAMRANCLAVWVAAGREAGVLGYPTGPRVDTAVGWVQPFQGGAIADSLRVDTPACVVFGVRHTAWVAAGRENGVLGYPRAAARTAPDGRGMYQTFTGGQLWALGSGPARVVRGAVLAAWTAAGGATGAYGYPVGNTTALPNGRLTCAFEHGTITA